MKKLFIAILIVIVSQAGPLAAEQLSRREYSVLEKVYLLMEKEQYHEGLELLQPLLNRKKPNSYAFSYGSLCYGSLNQISEARALLTTAVQAYPEKSSLWFNLGIFQLQLEDFSGAVQSYRTLITLDGNKVARDIHYRLGFALYRLGKYREAVISVGRITSDSPQKHWLQLEAYCYMELKEWTEAERVALKMVALEPMAIDGWNLLASIRMSMEDYASAAAYLEIGRLLAPDRAQHGTLGSLYGAQSAWNEQVLHLEPQGKEPYQLARRLNASSRFQDALDLLAKESEPKMESALLKGSLLFAVGRRVEAVESLFTVEKLPCGYTSLTGKKQDSKKARRQYKDRLCGRALLLAGQILWLDHNWHRARDVFKRLELLPGFEEVGKNLASCMQSWLEEQKSELDLPGVFDPALVVEVAGS